MKITLVNTYDRKGGGSIACLRLTEALASVGQQAQMLVSLQGAAHPLVTTLSPAKWRRRLADARMLYERAGFLPYDKQKKVNFAFSVGNSGIDVSQHPLIQAADVVHLHWIGNGFLSLSSLEKLAALNKPVVWTAHDQWAFTGGCFYSGDCRRYEDHCGQCPFVARPSDSDVSARLLARKKKIYEKMPLTLVTCSDWLGNLAQNSSALRNIRVQSIPNPINTQTFRPIDAAEARKKYGLPQDKKLILFGSSKIGDPRKGFVYLKEALLKLNHRERNLEVVVFGALSKEDEAHAGGVKIHALGYLGKEEQVALAYNACDLMALPSLADNLPNTVMESMACGTPVAAFATGGIPQMVDHQTNGWLAAYLSAEELAQGIDWLLANPERYAQLSENARQKVCQNYDYPIVAQRYVRLYEELLSPQKIAAR